MTIDAGIKKRFLIRIVDDDVGVRAGLTFLLKCLGWSSVDYLSAEEFLEKDNMLIPGCILLDIRMPGMSGLALQQKLFFGRCSASGCHYHRVRRRRNRCSYLETRRL